MAYAKGEFEKNTDYYTKRAAEILQWMTAASINPENLETLRKIVKNGVLPYNQWVENEREALK